MCAHVHVSVDCADSAVVVFRTPDLSAFISPITLEPVHEISNNVAF